MGATRADSFPRRAEAGFAKPRPGTHPPGFGACQKDGQDHGPAEYASLVGFAPKHYSPRVSAASTDSTPSSSQGRVRYWPWLGGLVMTLVTFAAPFGSPLFGLAWHGYHYGQPLSLVPSMLLVALLAPLVSYRRIDALFLLVPIWNLVVVWRIGYRLSKLSQRDWPPTGSQSAARLA